MKFSLKLKQTYLQKIKFYALQNNIPIIKDETCFFLQKIIKEKKIINILEIGTAIGYSALAISNEETKIQTLERDYFQYCLATHFLKKVPFYIQVIWSEAIFYQPKKNYDLIFIDAAKVQYLRLFKKYSFFVKKGKIIICDNLNFHNLDINQVSRSTKRILTKLNDFKNFLQKNNKFKTVFKNIGDGLSISWKKNNF